MGTATRRKTIDYKEFVMYFLAPAICLLSCMSLFATEEAKTPNEAAIQPEEVKQKVARYCDFLGVDMKEDLIGVTRSPASHPPDRWIVAFKGGAHIDIEVEGGGVFCLARAEDTAFFFAGDPAQLQALARISKMDTVEGAPASSNLSGPSLSIDDALKTVERMSTIDAVGISKENIVWVSKSRALMRYYAMKSAQTWLVSFRDGTLMEIGLRSGDVWLVRHPISKGSGPTPRKGPAVSRDKANQIVKDMIRAGCRTIRSEDIKEDKVEWNEHGGQYYFRCGTSDIEGHLMEHVIAVSLSPDGQLTQYVQSVESATIQK